VGVGWTITRPHPPNLRRFAKCPQFRTEIAQTVSGSQNYQAATRQLMTVQNYQVDTCKLQPTWNNEAAIRRPIPVYFRVSLDLPRAMSRAQSGTNPRDPTGSKQDVTVRASSSPCWASPKRRNAS
jgi:hypothetical protein